MMTIWILFALLTLGLALVLLRPLLRPKTLGESPEIADLTVYREQLAELDREQELGRIAAPEAEAARAEISRRLLAAAQETTRIQDEKPNLNKAIALFSAILLPLFAIGIYNYEGRPDLPGLQQADRLADAEAKGDFDALVYKVRRHLQQNPQDAQGWQVLIRALTDLQRYAQAAEAWRGYLKIAPATADNLANFGEALVLANNGLMTSEAEKVFQAAINIDPQHAMARFFTGLAARQIGENQKAINLWQQLLDEAPADAPWKQAVADAIANAKSALNSPQNSSMPNPQQVDASMIRGMVDGLAARLKEDGNDLEGWLRLARSYQVLGEIDKARDALDQAEINFKQDDAAMTRIRTTRAELENPQ